MTLYSYELKIPIARVPVLIGRNGQTKKEIQAATKTSIQVDSREGDVFITGEDALGLYTAREIIHSIGRGFNPEIALLLIKQDYACDQISLSGQIKTKKHQIRVKGRIIGAEGKTRRLIEELTECNVSVYGKTVAMIGQLENIAICRKAIEKILLGSQHSSVYRWLEAQRRNIKRKKVMEDAHL